MSQKLLFRKLWGVFWGCRLPWLWVIVVVMVTTGVYICPNSNCPCDACTALCLLYFNKAVKKQTNKHLPPTWWRTKSLINVNAFMYTVCHRVKLCCKGNQPFKYRCLIKVHSREHEFLLHYVRALEAGYHHNQARDGSMSNSCIPEILWLYWPKTFVPADGHLILTS